MKRHLIPRDEDGAIDRVRWLQMRRDLGCFNASDAGVLYGNHPFRTLGDWAVSKLRPAPITEDVQTEYQSRGHFLESSLAAWLSHELSIAIVEPTWMYEANGIAQTPDAEIVGSDTDQPELKSHMGYLDGELLPWWRHQAIAQIAARPTLQRIHFAVLDSSLRFQHYVVEPYPGEVEDLIERAQRAMAFVALDLVPDEADLSERNVRDLWPTPTPTLAVEADAEIAEVAVEWMQTRTERLVAEKIEKKQRDLLADYLREAEVLTLDGDPLVTFKTNGRGRTLAPAKGMA